MQLVEKHVIRKTDPRFALIDRAAFAGKSLCRNTGYSARGKLHQQGKFS